jgi:hypothetical protein
MKTQTLRVALALVAAGLCLTAAGADAQDATTGTGNNSCQQATADANKAYHQAAGLNPSAATDSLGSAIDNAGRCIFGNPTPVQDDPPPAPAPSPAPDTSSSSDSDSGN